MKYSTYLIVVAFYLIENGIKKPLPPPYKKVGGFWDRRRIYDGFKLYSRYS